MGKTEPLLVKTLKKVQKYFLEKIFGCQINDKKTMGTNL